jgi:hypothetical protein
VLAVGLRLAQVVPGHAVVIRHDLAVSPRHNFRYIYG